MGSRADRLVERLERLADLHRKGALTDIEYVSEKAKALADDTKAVERGPNVPPSNGPYRAPQNYERSDTSGFLRAFYFLGAGLVVLGFIAYRLPGNKDVAPIESTAAQDQEPQGISASPQPAAALSAPTAIFTCRAGGMTHMPVFACFTGSHDNVDGSLKISTGGRTMQFSGVDLVSQLGVQTKQIPLTSPFEIFAQTNGDDTFVLHLEIRDGDKTLFQDEATGFGVIRVDSDSLHQ